MDAGLESSAGDTGSSGSDAASAETSSLDATSTETGGDGATGAESSAGPDTAMGPDAGGTDAPPALDGGASDGSVGPDVAVGPEAGSTDAARVDVPTTCTGTLGVTVAAPTMGQVLETCTASGMPVYFDFTSTVTGGTGVTVVYNWRNPDGLLVAPPVPSTTAPSYTARRQVGGLMTAGGLPPLAIAGGRNAIGGTWRVEVAATDTCGRTAMASQTFTLGLTSRGCPNP